MQQMRHSLEGPRELASIIQGVQRERVVRMGVSMRAGVMEPLTYSQGRVNSNKHKWS